MVISLNKNHVMVDKTKMQDFVELTALILIDFNSDWKTISVHISIIRNLMHKYMLSNDLINRAALIKNF